MRDSLKLNVLSFLSEVSIVALSVYLPYRAFQLGADSVTAGIIGGASSVVYMFMPFTMGRLSDRLGGKTVFLAGAATLSLVSLSYFLLTNLGLIIMIRIIEGIGWAMIWPPLESMASSDINNAYRNLARFNISWGLGAAVAPGLGSVVAEVSGIKYVFLSISLLMLIALILSATLNARTTKRINEEDNKMMIKLSILIPLYFTMTYGIVTNVITTFFPKYAAISALSDVEWGSIISFLLFARLLAFIVAENVRRKIGIKNMFAPFSFLSLFFPCLGLFVGSNFLILATSAAITGFSIGLVYAATLNKVMIDSFGGKGMAAGMFESSIGMGTLAGPLLAGVLASWQLRFFFFLPIVSILIGGFLGIAKRESLSISSS